MHSPIKIKNISLSYPNKNCFEDFSNTIYPGSRISLIGRNGCGKSSLLNILRGQLMPTSGACVLPDDLIIGYVEQTIADFRDLSGRQRLNKRLSKFLAKSPNLLLLDEPTNHLDQDNRKSLMQMLKDYQVTLDTELLRCSIETLWHIEHAHAITKIDVSEMRRCAKPSCDFNPQNPNELIIKYGTFGSNKPGSPCSVMEKWHKEDEIHIFNPSRELLSALYKTNYGNCRDNESFMYPFVRVGVEAALDKAMPKDLINIINEKLGNASNDEGPSSGYHVRTGHRYL